MFAKHSPYADKLRSLGRFEGLTDHQVHEVVDRATHLTSPAGWALISEDTPADKAYLLLDGEVSIRRHGEEIARLGPGDMIGEVAIVTHHLRTATVISTTPLELLHFTAEAVAELSARIPAFGRALEATVAERIHPDEGRQA